MRRYGEFPRFALRSTLVSTVDAVAFEVEDPEFCRAPLLRVRSHIGRTARRNRTQSEVAAAQRRYLCVIGGKQDFPLFSLLVYALVN
jgi:hypothetical protein